MSLVSLIGDVACKKTIQSYFSIFNISFIACFIDSSEDELSKDISSGLLMGLAPKSSEIFKISSESELT